MALPIGRGFAPRTPDNPDGYHVPYNIGDTIMVHGDLWGSILAARQRHNERIIRWLLGLWVSEVEPSIMYGPRGMVVGLGHGGRIILDAPRYLNGRELSLFN